IRRQVIDDNLRHAFPDRPADERRELARAMWEHLFLFVAEVAHVPRKIHETNWRDYVRLRNADVLVGALLSERPTLVVSAHFGNFELAGYVMGIFGFPTHTVARTLDNPDLDGFLNRFRSRTGQHIVPKKGGYDQIVSVLVSGGTMTLLADQYAGSKGCWVDFFGRPASTHKAIALLSLSNDAPVVVGAARRIGGPLRYEMSIEGVADPRSTAPEASGVRPLTQWYTCKLEALIRRSPEQYWWLHRRWKEGAARSGRRRRAPSIFD
ncbi:MAG: lysophospholipid acyltransferase family protein, partial [Planctomycetes bacterium]|nr:lysophospholipid acyltransferase family protein [Planctomycetota bacterium]